MRCGVLADAAPTKAFEALAPLGKATRVSDAKQTRAIKFAHFPRKGTQFILWTTLACAVIWTLENMEFCSFVPVYSGFVSPGHEFRLGFAICRGKPALARTARPLSLALQARRASQDGGRAGMHRVAPDRRRSRRRHTMRAPCCAFRARVTRKTLTNGAIAAPHSCLRDARDASPERAPDHLPPPLSSPTDRKGVPEAGRRERRVRIHSPCLQSPAFRPEGARRDEKLIRENTCSPRPSLPQPRRFAASTKKKAPGKAGTRYYKNVGLGFKTPRTAIEGACRRRGPTRASPSRSKASRQNRAFSLRKRRGFPTVDVGARFDPFRSRADRPSPHLLASR